MQPEPADHRLRPTSTVKGQCFRIVPLHFYNFMPLEPALQDTRLPLPSIINPVSRTRRRPAKNKTRAPCEARVFCLKPARSHPAGSLDLESVFGSPDGKFNAGAELELLERVLDVNLDRTLRDPEAF